MKPEEFIYIMRDEELDDLHRLDGVVGCPVLEGLKIITKYLPTIGVMEVTEGAIYSAGISIIAPLILKEDAEELAKWGWSIDSDCLCKFI